MTPLDVTSAGHGDERRRVLVTGGAGFIGSHLVKHMNCQNPNWQVVVLDDFSSGSEENLAATDAIIYRGSVLNTELLEESMVGVDTVVHLAAIGNVQRSIESPLAISETNIIGSLKVLETARAQNVLSTIFASSSSVYGSNTNVPKSENDWVGPLSPYAASKLAAESYALAYGFSYGMNVMAFRFFNVFGPGQPAGHAYAAVVPRFIDAALHGRSLEIYGDGMQFRDFTYVSNVVEGIYAACLRRISQSRPVNLAFGTRTTILDLANLIRTLTDAEVEILHLNERQADARASQADGQIFGALYPEIKRVSLREGLENTVEWHRNMLP